MGVWGRECIGLPEPNALINTAGPLAIALDNPCHFCHLFPESAPTHRMQGRCSLPGRPRFPWPCWHGTLPTGIRRLAPSPSPPSGAENSGGREVSDNSDRSFRNTGPPVLPAATAPRIRDRAVADSWRCCPTTSSGISNQVRFDDEAPPMIAAGRMRSCCVARAGCSFTGRRWWFGEIPRRFRSSDQGNCPGRRSGGSVRIGPRRNIETPSRTWSAESGPATAFKSISPSDSEPGSGAAFEASGPWPWPRDALAMERFWNAGPDGLWCR